MTEPRPALKPDVEEESNATIINGPSSTVVLGAYDLLEEIAAGGMGVVYKARHRVLDRIVALKLIMAGQLARPEEIQRFRIEAQAAARLEHPHIVPVYEIYEEQGRHYFAMGYVAGQSLARRIADRGPLAPREAARLIQQVAEAVDFAHRKGIVHRDLKPGNVLLDTDGQPRVTDFGLAKQMDSEYSLTATGQILGTPAYMAPEQALGKPDLIGPACDVYGLGATLYAALTGKPPFEARSAPELFLKITDERPASLRSKNKAVPRDLEAICLKCLEKDAAQRYRSAGELADDLNRFLRREPVVARPVGTFAGMAYWSRRHPVPATAACLAVIGLLVTTAQAVQTAASRAQTIEQLAESADQMRIKQKEVEKARDEETQSRQQAEQAQQQEQKARGAAEEATRKAQWSQYVSMIQAADLALKNNNIQECRRMLNDAPVEHRNWEWGYLKQQTEVVLHSYGVKAGMKNSALSPDQKWLALATGTSPEGLVQVIDVWTGAVRWSVIANRGAGDVSDVCWSPDGTRVASSQTGEKSVKIWDATTGELLREY